MIILRGLYTLYAGILFLLTFLLLFPVFVSCIWIPGWEPYGRKVNQFWAKIYFTLIFMPIKIEGKENIKKGQAYIFAANHFSYLDIAMMGFIPGDVVYIGKSSIRKVPLFGYYFRKLHIAVDRNSLKSRGEVLIRAKKHISKGSSIVIFPEGGITSTQPPTMSKFKDGAFSLAEDKQIPVIPVTLSYNHLILPDDGRLLMNFKSGKIVIHPALSTAGMNSKNIPELKQKCFRTIQEQLIKDNPETIK
ncbi:1-acyl-sn-glycerol-3-phosphate acyltransferase [Indibacter alkaliphilus LW1]|uniref:1-acyl-sn-glycerol-3-phosphate acyltransferase n=1 Tax=Indibacter alkaliphilus (strain CCUG 57479 / KCTC 22604 / LW1) TaxID=1189612 RepID=S2D9Y2_INDAL|nr:lysophospholipid acyltransferase family protein [Indibacter alkaliphilus]EOZ95719.1 1-acyl-sn-glycerol-3-phosphate acyltransferase [Indibacter alkaliphilus LW1]